MIYNIIYNIPHWKFPYKVPIALQVIFFFTISREGDSKKKHHMRKTDARTVRFSGSVSIANDGSEQTILSRKSVNNSFVCG